MQRWDLGFGDECSAGIWDRAIEMEMGLCMRWLVMMTKPSLCVSPAGVVLREAEHYREYRQHLLPAGLRHCGFGLSGAGMGVRPKLQVMRLCFINLTVSCSPNAA